MANYALGLDYLTGALVFVAFLEIWLLIKADQTARRAIDSADQQAAILASQTDILTKQKEIARQQFLAAHRPKMIARGFDWEKGSTDHPDGGVGFLVLNTGQSDACRIEVECIVTHTDKALGRLNFDVEAGPRTCAVGEGRRWVAPLNAQAQWARASELHMAGNYYCIGVITYRDGLGTHHETGFCRRLNMKTGTWDRVPDQEREYDF